jgi:hypothetical protein
MTTTAGAQILPAPKVDYAYMTGTDLGEFDYAFAHLATLVDGTTAVAAGIGVAPTANEQVSAFGFGCTDRSSGSGVGTKRFVDYTYGSDTHMNCPGDSGGPRFHGFHTGSGSGSIWGINSALNDFFHDDLVASAWAYAPRVLRGLQWFGGTTSTNFAVTSFPGLAQQSGVKVVTGDFDGNGTGDVAALGGPGWTTIPIALGDGRGGFSFLNASTGLQNFVGLVGSAKHIVAADFDGNGTTDIALLGGLGWTTIPIAFSNGNGTFSVTNQGVANLPQWSRDADAVVAGDFDADGDGDIALVGGVGWTTVPMGFSNRDGAFVQTNTGVASFPGWAHMSGAQAFAGDFDGDGDADIALTGSTSFGSIPVAFSNRVGGFAVTNSAVDDFPIRASTSGAKIAVGDFDGDGDADLAAVGANGWRSLHFALSNGSGGFLPAYPPNPDFAGIASGARFALGVRANKDAASDLVLAGGTGWQSIPVAFLKLARVVTQSSTDYGGTADRAFDGNTDGNFGANSVTHTAYEAQAWWRVDLRVLTHIGQILVYNRTDCCADRLTNFNVSVSANGSTWTTVNVAGQASTPTLTLFDTWARYVRVQLVGTNNLSLAEVQVIE